jgi:hypothetical protein
MNRIFGTVLLASFTTCLVQAQPLYVSTEEDFSRPGAAGGYISDGDILNWTTGNVFMRNAALLTAFQRPDTCDLGLDALDVIDDGPTTSRLVAFSTELPISTNAFGAGDLVATNGAIIKNAALFAAFVPAAPSCNFGLDAIQFIGKEANIRQFLNTMATNPVPNAQVPGLMNQLQIDLWFSTEGTCDNGVAGPPMRFLDGDVLSVVNGGVIIPQAVLMAAAPAPGIPGLDRGLDGLVAPRTGVFADVYFSTEILNVAPLLTDGDLIRIGAAAPTLDYTAISAPFAPPAPFVGLDAMSYFK